MDHSTPLSCIMTKLRTRRRNGMRSQPIIGDNAAGPVPWSRLEERLLLARRVRPSLSFVRFFLAETPGNEAEVWLSPRLHGAFASTYKRSNIFNHCTVEASLYERATADRTTSNTVITPTPANAASARLCQSKSPLRVTMQAPERTKNDEQHSQPNATISSPSKRFPRASHTSPGTSTISPNPTAPIPAPTTAPNADCPTR